MVVQRDDAIHPLHADDWLAVGFMPSMGREPATKEWVRGSTELADAAGGGSYCVVTINRSVFMCTSRLILIAVYFRIKPSYPSSGWHLLCC